MPRVPNYNIIGCYAQTELGHGSNVRRLEMVGPSQKGMRDAQRASGGIAQWRGLPCMFYVSFYSCTTFQNSKATLRAIADVHRPQVVMVQLLLPQSCSALATNKVSKPTSRDSHYITCGPETFILQIREKMHQFLLRIAVGVVGPKYGYASMNNAYMVFGHFRAPKSAMLSRYAKISDETGTLSRTGHPAVVHGSPTFVRGQIIMHERLVLA
jgi:acyl-CoA oxidase